MVSSANNGINDTVGASISGVTNTLTVTNPSNTASSAARATVVVGGGSSSDPSLNWSVSGVTNWEMGIDNSDSDKWKLSQGTALGTNDTITADINGQVLKPLQSNFFSYATVVTPNVTGDGSGYTVIFDTVDYDINSNYDNTTGIFTAPVSGTYIFNSTVRISGITAAHVNGRLNLVAAGTTCRCFVYDPANSRTDGNFSALNGSLIIKLNANDQVHVQINVGGGAKVINVQATGNFDVWFSGCLLC